MFCSEKAVPVRRSGALRAHGVHTYHPAGTASGLGTVTVTKQLSPMDAIPLYLETATSNGNVGVMFCFDGPLPFREYADGFAQHRLGHLPRFRQNVVRTAFNLKLPVLQDDPSFNLDDHLHDVELDPPGSDDQLRAFIDKVFNIRFDFRVPAWNLYVVNGLADGTSVLFLHYHHCLSDGVGLVNRVFPALLDGLPMFPDAPRPADLSPSGIADDSKSARRFATLMREFAGARGADLPFCRALSGRAHHTSTSFDLADAQAIRSALGGTTNDVLLAVLGGAVDRLQGHRTDAPAETYCRIIQAANTRRADEHHVDGNRVAFLPALVPLGLSDPVARLRRIVDYTGDLRRSGVRAATDDYLRRLPKALPPPLLNLAFRLLSSPSLRALGNMIMPMPAIDMYLSYVRWTDADAHIGQRRMTGPIVLAPLMPNTGLSCVAFTYAGRIFVGLTADADTFPQVDAFAADMNHAFEELLASATGHTNPRRAAL